MHVFFAPITPCFSQSDSFKTKKAPLEKQPSLKKVKEEMTPDEDACNKVANLTRRKKSPNAITSQLYYRSTLDNQGGLDQTGSGLTVCSGLNIITCTAGEAWPSASGGASIADLAIPPEYASGSWRLVATGYEVHNTTPELYKGGSVTAYKSPGAPTPGLLVPPGTGAIPDTLVTLPPLDQPSAALYPNSKTWQASEGIYQVVSLSELSNPFVTPTPSIAGMVSPSSFQQLSDGSGWLAYLPQSTSSVGIQSSCSHTLPFDVCGCIFAGLNSNSTMQVTVKYVFERAPTIADPDLLVLAKPAPPYDAMAFEIYSRALDELPVAVPVSMNPLGEWFADVLDAVGKYGPAVGKAIGGMGVPFAGAVGQVLGTAASSAKKLMTTTTTTTTKPAAKGGKQVVTTTKKVAASGGAKGKAARRRAAKTLRANLNKYS